MYGSIPLIVQSFHAFVDLCKHVRHAEKEVWAMHRQLIADAADAMALTERGLFIVGLQLKRGMQSDAIADTAGRDHEKFVETGLAPEYMVDFAIDRINAERNRVKLKATKTVSSSRIGPTNHLVPSGSGVDELSDRDGD